MSVIIRLQNLPWSANALDIRQYFQGLSIPEGGVHIVGGELGDAFIAFSTDEDARQAFNLNNGKVKGVQIKLMLSSRTEMQKVIEAARSQSFAAFMPTPQPPRIPPAVATILPSVVPSAVPDIKRDATSKDKDAKNDKRDKRRSRSRSRDRKDRSKERDRRDRRRKDRSRSRSRDRRDRRRRDHSRSRDRTRSKERDHRRKDHRSPDKSVQPKENQVIWEPPQPQLQNPAANLLAFPGLLAAQTLLQQDPTFQQPSRDAFQTRWNPTITKQSPPHNFQAQQNRFPDDRFGNQNRNRPLNSQPTFEAPNTFNNNRQMAGRPINSNSNSPTMNSRYNNGDNRGAMPQEPNCCVQLQSFMGGFGEIRRFFQGLFIHSTGIKFVNDNFGKRTGLVYIRFAKSEGKAEALRRSGGMLRGQTVKVMHLDDEVFDNTVDRYHPSMFDEDSEQAYANQNNVNPFLKTPFTALIVEDLPNYAKEQDILKMFSDYSLMSIILLNKPRKVTLAYVKFSNAEDAKLALQDENKHIVDGKVVTVKPCKDEDFEIVQREETGFTEPMAHVEPFKNSNILLLSRLPLKTTDRDVSDFFSDIGIIPTKVHLLSNNMGFTGEAYCEFSDTNDAKTAMQKNGMPMGTSVISVKSVEKEEMEGILGIQKEEEQEEMEDLHKIITERDNMHIERNDMHPRNNFQPRMPPNMRPQMGMNQPLMNRPPMYGMRNNFMNGPGGPMHRGPNFMGPRGPRRYPPPHMQHMNASEDVFGPPGCTVLMENVPFQATIDEILDFFEGYDIPADNILRRYNPNGKPSGESKVIFKNPDDAYQAVHEKQEHKIRDRTIYLSLC